MGSDRNVERPAPRVASQTQPDPDATASDVESQSTDVETDESLKDTPPLHRVESATLDNSNAPITDSEMDHDNGEKGLEAETQSGRSESEGDDNARLEAAQENSPKNDGQSPVEDSMPEQSSEQASTDDKQTNDIEPTVSDGQRDAKPEASGDQAPGDPADEQEADNNGEIVDTSAKNGDVDNAEGILRSTPPEAESLFAEDDAGSEGGLDSAGNEVRADEIVRDSASPPPKIDGANLIRNGDFQSGTAGWIAKCPEEQKNGHEITGTCTTSGVWIKVPATSKGADTKAYHLKDRCFEQTKGGVFQDFSTEHGYTYQVSYKVIDGWFNYKNGENSSLSYVEIESPLGSPVADVEMISTSSVKEPVRGVYETAPTFEFVAAGSTSSIYFYAGPGSCANIDDVKVIKTNAPRLTVYPLSSAIAENRVLATPGSFDDDFSNGNPLDARVIGTIAQNKVDLYPSGSSNSKGYNDLDVDLPSWTHGGCPKMAGSAKLTQGTEPISMTFQAPRGSEAPLVNVGTGGVVFSPDVDDSPLWIRLRTFSESNKYEDSATLETRVFFYCHTPSREKWTLNTFHFAGLDGLCLSVAASDAQDDDFGCHDLTCRRNGQSDATLQPCDATAWSQSFYLDDKGLMHSASMADRCLEVASIDDRECLPLTLSHCDSQRDTQQFSKVPGTSQDVKLKAYGERFLSVMQAKDKKPAYDQWIQACKPQANSIGKVDAFSMRLSKINPQKGAEEATELAGRASVPTQPLAENSALISNVWAEAICPWFFDPPVTTGSENMKCYDATLCDEASCCDAHGGIFLCSKERPYMCAGVQFNGTKAYDCKSAPDECDALGGRRKCEGPPGSVGPEGAAGPAGTQGEAGGQGAQGPEGAKGGTSENTSNATGEASNSTGEALLQTVVTESKSWGRQPATVMDCIGALVINLLMCSMFYASLKAKVRSLDATSADAIYTARRASVAASVAGEEAKVALSAPPSAPPSVPAGSAPPSAPASEAGEVPQQN
eukprot:TRINITY_DN33290_c0_g1_i1.p1 TRINITY_DN33290_c0_g1~~TRINITY_DN33290_c0_g1_i1.p1  ORF type:complete len:1137 (-),score=198.50 TRINITY_DN33290_c0_g1_i1:130-3138(-)